MGARHGDRQGLGLRDQDHVPRAVQRRCFGGDRARPPLRLRAVACDRFHGLRFEIHCANGVILNVGDVKDVVKQAHPLLAIELRLVIRTIFESGCSAADDLLKFSL